MRDGRGLGGERKDGSACTSDLRVAGFAESCNDNVPLQNAACNNGEDICPQLLQCHKPTAVNAGEEGGRKAKGRVREDTGTVKMHPHTTSQTPPPLTSHHTLLSSPQYM